MVNQEKGAVPWEDNFNLMLNQKKEEKLTRQWGKRRSEHGSQRAMKGSTRARATGWIWWNRAPWPSLPWQTILPLLKTGAKTDQNVSHPWLFVLMFVTPENYRFHSHTSLHICWWRMDSHHRDGRRRIQQGDWWSNPSTQQGTIKGQMLGMAFRKAKGRMDEGKKERQCCHHYCGPSEP